MRIAIILSPDDMRLRRERQARRPEMADPDPDQRLVAERLSFALSRMPAYTLVGEAL